MSHAETFGPFPLPAKPAETARPTRPTPRTRLALATLGAALLLGVQGDMILRETPWGLGAALWAGELAAAALLLGRWGTSLGAASLPRGALRWGAAALLMGSLLAWRDSPSLKGAAMVAVLLALALAIHRARGGRVWGAGIGSCAVGMVTAAGEAAWGAGALAGKDVGWNELPRGGAARSAGVALRGLMIAVPVLAVFTALLSAADAAFAGILERAFAFDLAAFVSHLLFALVVAWAVGGGLRALLLSRTTAPGEVVRPEGLRLGIGEVSIALGLVNLLFLAFGIVQLRYLFGGADVVLLGETLSYSDYARRGFFELVAVCALVLPLLLAAHWAVRRDGAPAWHGRLFTALAGVQLALVAGIVASALYRMSLYTQAYGLTELRLYATAFMGWIAIVLAWFAATVLRGRGERFAFGALMAGALVLGTLQAASPDALIVRVNASRADAASRFDGLYAASLSGDAVPALLETLPGLAPPARCQAAEVLLRRWGTDGGEDWRTWSWGRWRARRAVAANADALRGWTCAAP